MKKTLLFLYLLLAMAAQASAQNVTNAFYLYRNDEPLRPFFFSSVDSICQSQTDIDSTLCDSYVVTEFWTTDSVYRVPIAAIDSIVFTTPDNVVRPGTVEITERQMSYLISCDSLTLRFEPGTPSSVLPKTGEKLYSFDVNAILERGFMGRVREITTGSDAIIVSCDSIGYSDAFDRLFIGGSMSSETNRAQSRALDVNRHNIHINPIDFSTPEISMSRFGEVSYDMGPFNFGLGCSVGLAFHSDLGGEYMIIKDDVNWLPTFYVDMTADNSVTLSGELSASLSVNLLDVFDCDFIKIPIPNAPLVYINIRPEIQLSGTISTELSLEIRNRCRAIWKWSQDKNLKREFSFKASNPLVSPDINFFSTTISASAGVFFGLKIGLSEIAELTAGVEAGRRYDLNVLFSKALWDQSEENTKLYDYVRKQDPSVIVWYVQPKVGLSLWDNFNVGGGYNFDIMPKDLSFFPGFSEVKYIGEEGNTHLTATIDDELLVPVQPGLRVTDEDGNVLFDEMETIKRTFDNYELNFPYIHRVFNKKCVVQPYVKIFDKIVLGRPTAEIELTANPMTQSATPKAHSATLKGYVMTPEDCEGVFLHTDFKVGFFCSSESYALTSGINIPCTPGSDLTFSGTVNGLQPGTTYYYCAYLTIDGETLYGETHTFRTDDESEAIDLGLSVLWRAYNLGAEQPQQYGAHYAWGETSAKNTFTWDTYFDNPYTDEMEWQGCKNNSDIAGNSEFDPSTALDGNWRMPTYAEMKELLDNCTWEWGVQKGTNGYTVTGPNGNSIFLPANGLGEKSDLQNQGSYGSYWTSTPQTDVDGKATAGTLYFFSSTLKSIQWANRYNGRGIRPVTPK